MSIMTRFISCTQTSSLLSRRLLFPQKILSAIPEQIRSSRIKPHKPVYPLDPKRVQKTDLVSSVKVARSEGIERLLRNKQRDGDPMRMKMGQSYFNEDQIQKMLRGKCIPKDD